MRLHPSTADLARFWSGVSKTDGCWLWTRSCTLAGYGRLRIHGMLIYTHRLSWEITHGAPIPPGLWVLHNCDNPPCVNPSHLRLGTARDNARDAGARGRTRFQRYPWLAQGANSPAAVLTTDAVDTIRHRYAAGDISQTQLGREYGIDQSQISRIVRRKTWRHQ